MTDASETVGASRRLPHLASDTPVPPLTTGESTTIRDPRVCANHPAVAAAWLLLDGSYRCDPCGRVAQASEHDLAIEARVRAEVAGQINLVADMLDGLALREQGDLERYDPAAEAFRRSAGIVRTLAAGSSPDTTPEPAREDYPGQRSTPEDCPVCGGRVEVDRLDVTSVFTPMAERPKTIPGRWWCPKGCDPRTTSEDS